jgi:glycosyltransferase involved in cell wall biosynthesis
VSTPALDIVCVGFSDWNSELLTNEQHLLTRLAHRNRILYVESLGLRRPRLGSGKDRRRIARRLVRGVTPPKLEDGVHVLSPLVLPVHHHPAAVRLNRAILARLVRAGVRRAGMRDPVLWSFVPQAEVLIDVLRPRRVLYYVDDDHAAKKGIDANAFRSAERRFAARADLVMASAPELGERMRLLNDHVVYAPNVADTALFATALDDGPVDPAIAALARPLVVFVGALIASKIDLGLTLALAHARPDWSFAFVGPVGPGDPGTDISPLRTAPNIHLLGPRPYEELPLVLRGANAAILPYHTGGEMRSVFPMKTYEYLAAGLPVVTTPLPALRDVPEVVVAPDAAAMAARLDEVMTTDTPQRRAERSRAVRDHSWEARVAQIEALLAPRPTG